MANTVPSQRAEDRTVSLGFPGSSFHWVALCSNTLPSVAALPLLPKEGTPLQRKEMKARNGGTRCHTMTLGK